MLASVAQRCNYCTTLEDGLIRAALTPFIPKNLNSLRKWLINSVSAHVPGKFLVVDKPFGISCVGYHQSNGGIFKNNCKNQVLPDQDDESFRSVKKGNAPTISEVVPFLSKAFNEPSLSFCVGLKRNISGPVVLTASNKAFSAIRKSLTLIGYEGVEHHRALVICVGKPERRSGLIKGYSTIQKVGDHQEYAFVEANERLHKRARTSKFAVYGQMKYELVASSYGCSLLDISFSKFERHLPRLMLTQILCPPMGDTLYLPRVVDIDGVVTLIAPQDLHRTKHVKRNFKLIMERLRLTETYFLTNLPLYFHVYRSTFPKFDCVKNESCYDLIASAPLSSHMDAMLKCLNLKKAAIDHLKSFENQSEESASLLSRERSFTVDTN